MLGKSTLNVRLRRHKSSASFTLVELLVVMAIIAILLGLTLAASSGVIKQAGRSRAKSEIQAISTKLEDYKSDNGAYPSTAAIALLTNSPGYTNTDGSIAGGLYQQSSQVLYSALSGKVNYQDTPTAGVKSYMSFRANQVGNKNTAAGTAYNAATATYIMDPWGYSYGYSTGNTTTPSYPYNGNYNYDLWSTSGSIGNAATNMGGWIANFQ